MKKEITYDGRDFLYEIKEHDCGDYGCCVCYTTEFYEPELTTYMRIPRYLIFGPMTEYKRHEHIFTLHYNIESDTRSKEEIRKSLRKQLGLLKRKEEILNGEII